MNKKILYFILLTIAIIFVYFWYSQRTKTSKNTVVNPLLPNVIPSKMYPPSLGPPDVIPSTPVSPPVSPPKPEDTFSSSCVSQKGVVNMMYDNYTLSCKAFNTGTNIDITSVFPVGATNTIEDYLKNVYPLANTFPDGFFDTLTFLYGNVPFNSSTKIPIATFANNAKLFASSPKIPFINTSHVEVAIQEPSVYKNLVPNNWMGCWYNIVQGSGFFIPVGATMMAYNSVHCLKLFKISPENILQYSSSLFKQQLTTLGKTIQQVLGESFSNFQYNYLNEELGPKRYLASMAAQKGYRTIQLSSEYDGKNFRRYFVDLIDPVLSTAKLIRKDPFSLSINPVKSHWYLNLFNESQIPDEQIINPESNKKFNEFPFKQSCRLAGGIISIKDVYLNCLKILKYGTPTQILSNDQNGDYSSYAKLTQLEKLQSYFTIVYGSPLVWKSKNEAQLQKMFDNVEILYNIPVKALNLTPSLKGNRVQQTIYSDPASPWYNPNITFAIFSKRPAETLTYIEVFRQNERFSLTEDPLQFAAFYYFPCRGSGYFIPTGKMIVVPRKEAAYIAIGQTVMPNSWDNDKVLAREMMYKGYETIVTVNFMGHSEVCDVHDAITSQMSLIRTHPFDPLVNTPSNNVVLSDSYFKPATAEPDVLHPKCMINHMFDGSVDTTCVY
jgi:hypothetical protein